eukprot:3431372-Prymnesium_polylepis.1
MVRRTGWLVVASQAANRRPQLGGLSPPATLLRPDMQARRFRAGPHRSRRPSFARSARPMMTSST